METAQGIFWLIVIFGIVWLLQKAKSSAVKALNQKVLFRSTHKEGQGLVTGQMVFDVAAPAAEIIRQLRTRVSVAQELPIGFKAVVYEKFSDEKKIVYACGNKLAPSIFLAAVDFFPDGKKTKVFFQVTNWQENGGIIVAQKELQKLRQEIEGVLADIGGEKNSFTKTQGDKFCQECGTRNAQEANFCKKCGKKFNNSKKATGAFAKEVVEAQKEKVNSQNRPIIMVGGKAYIPSELKNKQK